MFSGFVYCIQWNVSLIVTFVRFFSCNLFVSFIIVCIVRPLFAALKCSIIINPIYSVIFIVIVLSERTEFSIIVFFVSTLGNRIYNINSCDCCPIIYCSFFIDYVVLFLCDEDSVFSCFNSLLFFVCSHYFKQICNQLKVWFT